MLQAPTNDRKTKADASVKTAAQLPEQEQALQLLGGLERSRQSQLLQERNNLAALQKLYGNQAVLGMKRQFSGQTPAAASPLSRGSILQRNCACGNTADALGTCAECQKSGEMSLPGKIQTKLKINQPRDNYEQEADRVAERIIRISDAKRSVQWEEMPEQEKGIQTKPLLATLSPLVQPEIIPEKEMEEIQTKRLSNEGFQSENNLESRLSNSKSGGSPLPDEVRAFMEPHFGVDFSQVRVHTGSEAARINKDLNAQAFTHKQDIYFGVGKSPAKDRLTAHELTHVVQQGGTGGKCSAVEQVQRQSLGTDPNSTIDPLDDPRMHPPGAPNARNCSRPSWCPNTFCEPWDNESMARHELNNDRLTLLSGIALAVNPRVVPVWATYLSGGAPPQDFTSSFGADFANSPTTQKTTTFLVNQIKSSLLASPPSFPIPRIVVNLDIATLIPSALTAINTAGNPNEMDFSIPRDIPGNLAGGIGDNQSACQAGAMPSPFNDARIAAGTVTVALDPTSNQLTVSPAITYTVQDTVDFCPGDCGNNLEQIATVPMSQFEATGIVGDVPFTVTFPARTPSFII